MQQSSAVWKKKWARAAGYSSQDEGYEGELVQVSKMVTLSCHVHSVHESDGELGLVGGIVDGAVGG